MRRGGCENQTCVLFLKEGEKTKQNKGHPYTLFQYQHHDRTVRMEQLSEMECGVLKRLLKEEGTARCLLLDCRSFLAFSAGHIRSAVNVRCNTIVRRRAKGSVSLDQILAGDEEVKCRLISGLYSAVILYDERTPDAAALKEDSTIALVFNTLGRDTFNTDVYLLKGQ